MTKRSVSLKRKGKNMYIVKLMEILLYCHRFFFLPPFFFRPSPGDSLVMII